MSFLGKKTTRQAAFEQGRFQIGTGGRVDDIAVALFNACADSSREVRDSVAAALRSIGRHQPDLILSTGLDVIVNSKLSYEHKVACLMSCSQIVEDNLDVLAQDLCLQVIKASSREMTASREIKADLQNAASSILVTLGRRFPSEVMEEILSKFDMSGASLPHYFVVKSLSDFAHVCPLHIVIRLGDALQRLLPLLGVIKHDNLRWVFAAALGHFAEAALYYDSNRDSAPIKKIDIGSFRSEFFTAAEHMFREWLNLREQQVRLGTVEALGHLCAVIQEQNFEDMLPRLLPGVLSLYKREREHLPITHGVYNILHTACSHKNTTALAQPPLLTETMSALITGVATPVSVEVPTSIKNHNELLRCFEELAIAFPHETLDFLLSKLESSEIRVRVAVLTALKHLVTRLKHLDNDRIVAGVKALIADTSPRVQSVLAQLISTMATENLLALEGGHALVAFVVRLGAITKERIDAHNPRKADPDDPSPMQLRDMARRVLLLITTTLPNMEDVLWPSLLEHLMPEESTGAIPTVSQCITHLATQKQEEDDLLLDFDHLINLPKPQAIISRVFVVLGTCETHGDDESHVLSMLGTIASVLHPSIAPLWSELVPNLVKFVQVAVKKDRWSQSDWEEHLLRWLVETIDAVNDDEWSMGLGEAFVRDIPKYNFMPNAQSLCYRMLGKVLMRCSHRDYIRGKLDAMFALSNHTDDVVRKGLATAFGYASATHLDMVLSKLMHACQNDMVAKSVGFFGLQKDKSEEEIAAVTCTVLLSFGLVSGFGPADLVTSRMDSQILSAVLPHMQKPLNPHVLEHSILTVDMIAKAMHPSALRLAREYVFRQRDELARLMLRFITGSGRGGASNTVRKNGLRALAALALLQPALSVLPPEATPVGKDGPDSLARDVLISVLGFLEQPADDEYDKLVVRNIGKLLAAFVSMQTDVGTLNALLQYVRPYITHAQAHVRRRALGLCSVLLSRFVEFVTVDTKHRPNTPFVGSGGWLAVFLPRCTDSEALVRHVALDAVERTVILDSVLTHGQTAKEAQANETVELIAGLSDRLDSDEAQDMFAVQSTLSKLLCQLLDAQEFAHALDGLLSALLDAMPAAANGACVALNTMFKTRGAELTPHIPDLVSGVLVSLEKMSTEQTINGTLHSLRSLGRIHQAAIVYELLDAPVPHPSHVVQALQVLARDEQVNAGLVTLLMDYINSRSPWDETDARKARPVPNRKVMSATAALTEILEVEELEDVATEMFPKLLTTVVLRIGTSAGHAEASAQALALLRTFLTSVKCEHIFEELESGEEAAHLGKEELYFEGVSKLTLLVLRDRPDINRALLSAIFEYLTKIVTEQRVVATVVFGQVVQSNPSDVGILKNVLQSLQQRVGDEDMVVKTLALRGLGNIAACGVESVNRYAQSVLGALLPAVDNANDAIAQEAMRALSHLFEFLDAATVQDILVNICMQIKPAFSHSNPEIRAPAIVLFGSLSRFGNNEATKDSFLEQIHVNLPTFILHLGTEEPEVVEACKSTLRRVIALLHAPKLAEIVDGRAFEPERPFNYDTIAEEFAKALVASFPDRANYYIMMCVNMFVSQWDEIKGNAAFFVGKSLRAIEVEKRAAMSLKPETISAALAQLLKERNPLVRQRAAEAMGLLWDY